MEKSSFFNAVNVNGTYDRTYKAEDFAAYFGTVLTSGIFPSPSTNLQVVASSDMTVTVKSGDAFINGYMYHNTDDLILELNTADGVLKRIDLVVVRLDHVNREIKCHIKTGTFGSSPVKPSLTRNEEVYELCLAEINIGNGIISINQDSIIDTRYNSLVCGIVNSLIEIDTEEIYSQMRGLIEQREEEFFKWFNDLKVNLDENVATNLQGQINVLEDDVLINNTSEDLLNEDVNSFKVGTGTVEGINKDYTEDMCQSVVTLDNIKGKTVLNGMILNSININNIYNVINENTTVNLLRGNPTPLVFAYDHQSSGCYLYDAIHDYNSSQRVAYLDLVDVKPNTTYCIKNFTNNLNLNMVGHMYDENYCKSDEDMGWGDNSNTRFVTTNSTTRKMCVYIRKQDNTELTQNEIDSLKIMVVEGDTEPMEYVESDYKAIQHTFNNIELRSLPNGVCDEIKDSKLIERVLYNDTSTNDFNVVEFSTSHGYGRLIVSLPNAHITRKDQLLCNVVPVYAYPEDSAKYTSPDENCIIVNRNDDDKSQIVFILSGRSTEERALQAILVDNPRKMIYKRDKEVTTPINLSILSNSCNTIKVQTPVPLTCTHKVSLNTKSQVEELQEVVKKEKKSVWQKIKELTDYKFNFDSNGYFKFPSIFGGLIIQWGAVELSSPTIDNIGVFPISFNKPIAIYSSVEGRDNNWNAYSNCHFLDNRKFRLLCFDNKSYNIVRWFAIGI